MSDKNSYSRRKSKKRKHRDVNPPDDIEFIATHSATKSSKKIPRRKHDEKSDVICLDDEEFNVIHSSRKSPQRFPRQESDESDVSPPDTGFSVTHSPPSKSSNSFQRKENGKAFKKYRRTENWDEHKKMKNAVTSVDDSFGGAKVKTEFKDMRGTDLRDTNTNKREEESPSRFHGDSFQRKERLREETVHSESIPNKYSISYPAFINYKKLKHKKQHCSANHERQSQQYSKFSVLQQTPKVPNTNFQDITKSHKEYSQTQNLMEARTSQTEYLPFRKSKPQFTSLSSKSDRYTSNHEPVQSDVRRYYDRQYPGSSHHHTDRALMHYMQTFKKDPSLPRSWEFTEFGKQHMRYPYPGVELTVMCYNVLSQDLLESHLHLYSQCDSQCLKWEYRKKKLISEIKLFLPDVICFQEVNDEHYETFFLPELEDLGYGGFYKKKSGNKKDGCATFYKRTKLKLVQAFPVDYYKGGMMDRDNIGLILQLRLKKHASKKKSPIFIANTHLLFNPRRGDIKLGQLMVLFAELNRVALKTSSRGGGYDYHPIILCGDFNSTQHSEIFKFIAGGYSHYEGLQCKYMSGQKAVLFKGSDLFMQRNFFSEDFGITDQCQYSSLARKRLLGLVCCPEGDLNVEKCETVEQSKQSHHTKSNSKQSFSPSTNVYNESKTPLQSAYSPEYNQGSVPYMSHGSGHLWHHLNFVSSHNYSIERLGNRSEEITTYHDAYGKDGCVVDHIFYNVKVKEVRTFRGELQTRNIEESQLKLIGRYGLMSSRELCNLGCIPNEFFPSDHLFLCVKFLLKT